ncbi:hypothetical protein V1478_013523 [Vespula squamosa]|uniref:Uncharacterized protein n=1 Tax=Vespula squamosa TaxID=30214 RepID=A0ABD2A5E5_VESSQ
MYTDVPLKKIPTLSLKIFDRLRNTKVQTNNQMQITLKAFSFDTSDSNSKQLKISTKYSTTPKKVLLH